MNGILETEMKKLFLATTTAVMLLAVSAPTFAAQSNENMDLKEMRRSQFFMMKQMIEMSMAHMKSQEEMMKHLSEMLQLMIDCGSKDQKNGAAGCN